MEVQEEATGSKEYLQIVKGKRTKRPRQACSLALTMASSSSSVAAEEGGGVSDENSGGFDDRATTTTASPTNSGEFTGGGDEEEANDMANCLILLAQGSRPTVQSNYKAGSYVYQCKTCDRCFPSFQALGGHRASHKKPKADVAVAGGEFEKKKLPPLVLVHENEGGGGDQPDRVRTALSLQIPNRVSAGNSNNKSRVHECSVCGAEFSSGQALGGHMRRHRTISVATTTTPSPDDHDDHSQQGKKSSRNNVLALDLNLPAAPEDDDHHRRESKFQQVIVFSAAPSLVDCHY